MRIAFIPPISMLRYCDLTDMQLMLPHLVEPVYGPYKEKFAELGRSSYIILDNGAAESRRVGAGKLLSLAAHYRIGEIAAPDVLGDSEKTIDLTSWFVNDNIEAMRGEGKPAWGFVAQGKTITECRHTVGVIMHNRGDMFSVVYLPRLIIDATENYYARIDLAGWIHTIWPQLAIHFFGASRMFPKEGLAVVKEVPFVRSMDTSQPWVYAYNGMTLQNYEREKGPARPREYFDLKWSDFEQGMELVNRNVEEMLSWMEM